MKATLDCLECVVRQSLRVGRLSTDDPDLQRRIIDEVSMQLPDLDLDQSPAAVSLCAYRIAAEISGNEDPYKALRKEQNDQVLALEPELRRIVRESRDPLDAALHLAAAGNIIDLGILESEHIDVQAAIDQALHERFAVNHTDALRRSLASCDDLLFFLDNAGEVVFDKILIEELAHHTSVTAVVKGAPILNDVIMEDAEYVGLADICPVIDNGGAFIGSPLSHISPAFRERMDRADVLIGKGQGNYETLDDYPGDVYLILKAKCEVVARHMGVQIGQVGLVSTRARHAELGEAPDEHLEPTAAC